MTQAYKTMGEAYREIYEFTDAHIGKLKKAYAPMKGKRLSLDNNKKLTMIVNKMTKDQFTELNDWAQAHQPSVINDLASDQHQQHPKRLKYLYQLVLL